MTNDELINFVAREILSCKSCFLNVYLRFYINDSFLDTFKLSRSYGYSYKGVSFGSDLICLLSNNFHYNSFDFISSSLRFGKVSCHGHGEFFGTDSLIIIFRRFTDERKKEKDSF